MLVAMQENSALKNYVQCGVSKSCSSAPKMRQYTKEAAP